MLYVEAPNHISVLPHVASVFLAGGITGTEDWQRQILGSIHGDFILYNPRRACYKPGMVINGGVDDVMKEQIAWEHRYLEKADLIPFWFPASSICPITLFELGAYCSTPKKILVGADPEYPRYGDLFVQLQLRRPEVVLVDSLQKLVDQINDWASSLSLVHSSSL